MHISRPDWAKWTHRVPKCLYFGTYCTLCARPALPGIDLCGSCRQLLKPCTHTDFTGITTTMCPGCGLEQVRHNRSGFNQTPALSVGMERHTGSRGASGTKSSYCADCAENEGLFLTRIVASHRYAYPVDRLIKRIKYRGDRQLARVMGSLLADVVAQNDLTVPLPQLLLPMPLHPDRLRQRGFNQAIDIAHWCGKRLDLPVEAQGASRIVDTGSLAGLNRQERQLRILGAFRAADTLAGKRVAIVDDVLTTGASARELAREIYDSGAESVELWVLARTSSRRVCD